ncbi:MAG: hypothetical protein FWH56_03980 [Betaproteobacteria bacterium]|nr:hypothetical protein [Betaproteobacteria bacterium]
MNMPMSIPLPLRPMQSQRFNVPPMLRRALLCCVSALVGASLLWFLSSVWRADAEAERNDARADTQKTAALLASARETEAARAGRAKRFSLVKAALESMPVEKSEWEQLSSLIEAHPHIAEPALNVQPAQPAFPASEHLPVVTLQRARIEAGLLHEEALLTLDAIATGSPAHVIPSGCSLWREADTAPVTLRASCEFDWITLAPSPE